MTLSLTNEIHLFAWSESDFHLISLQHYRVLRVLHIHTLRNRFENISWFSIKNIRLRSLTFERMKVKDYYIWKLPVFEKLWFSRYCISTYVRKLWVSQFHIWKAKINQKAYLLLFIWTNEDYTCTTANSLIFKFIFNFKDVKTLNKEQTRIPQTCHVITRRKWAVLCGIINEFT